jgi:preprotein translocase subunit SecF
MFSTIPKINFMAARYWAMGLSVVLMIGSVISLIIQQLEFGLDFTGGTQIEVSYDKPAEIENIRQLLGENGFGSAQVQHFGKPTELLVRIKPENDADRATIGDRIFDVLKGANPEAKLQRVEFVGPQVGEDLRDKSGSAMIFALILILVYITLRFRFKFALGAVIALIHDVLLVVGFFSVTRMQFDLTVLAAILAVIGYSINDTIVVADRVRENFRKLRECEPADLINQSLNETLGRTTITSGTTLLVLVALALFGGEMIFGFAIALIVGIAVGTYSSIYVASSLALTMNICREDFLEPEKEDVPDMP